MARHHGLLFALLLAPAAFAADAPEYVLELHDSPDVSAKDVVGVFQEKLGVSPAQSMPLVQRISESGSSVVLMGPEVTCQKIAAFFEVHATLHHPHTRTCTRSTGAGCRATGSSSSNYTTTSIRTAPTRDTRSVLRVTGDQDEDDRAREARGRRAQGAARRVRRQRGGAARCGPVQVTSHGRR